MNKKNFAVALVLAACFIAASGAYAFGGFGNGFQGNEEMQTALENADYKAFLEAIAPKVTEEQFQQMVEMNNSRQAIDAALEAGDYDAWVAAIESQPKITDYITEENFADYVAMHEAMQSGDMKTARAISEELGIAQFNPFNGTPHGGMGFREGMHAGQSPEARSTAEGS